MNLPTHITGVEQAVGLPAKPLHVAIGMFDGVHLGHRAVIDAAIQSAHGVGGVTAVLTFDPHPSALFRSNKPTRLIMDPSAKARLLISLGVDLVITQPFTAEFASIDAAEFLPWLKKGLPNLAALYVGEDWRFGTGRRGDIALLVTLAHRQGISVFSAPPVNFDGEQVSSTRIRGLLESGKIEAANALLGAPYASEGVVRAGKRLGRSLGFPTLNLPWSPGLRPKLGVYAVRVSGAKSTIPLPGLANYGLRPTVETSTEPLLETHLLVPCPYGTGDTIFVEWLHFVRPEMKFSGVEQLRTQIGLDVDQARKALLAS